MHLSNDNFRRYVNIVAISLVYGWIQTMEYVKGWPTIHAFCFMVKLIFVKDILRIICIYAFVLIGFALAFHVYVESLIDSTESGGTNVLNSLYLKFGLTTGLGVWSDMSLTEEHDTTHGPVFASCICVSTIVLMNILIAMMNKTYEDVTSLQEALWCIDVLQFVDWITQDSWLRMLRELCRRFLAWRAYSKRKFKFTADAPEEYVVVQKKKPTKREDADSDDEQLNRQMNNLTLTVEKLPETVGMIDRRSQMESANQKAAAGRIIRETEKLTKHVEFIPSRTGRETGNQNTLELVAAGDDPTASLDTVTHRAAVRLNFFK